MAAYLRHQFVLHGVGRDPRERAWRAVRADVDARHGRGGPAEALALAERCWDVEERELQYVGAWHLARHADGLPADALPRVRRLLVERAWWDTVDVLAPKVVGALAANHPAEVVPVLDRWSTDEDRWLVRTALLHQLGRRGATDRDRLARYVRAAAGQDEFFVAKAVGWALRQYSSVDPAWVEAFVDTVDLRPLSRREALKAIRRRRERGEDV